MKSQTQYFLILLLFAAYGTFNGAKADEREPKPKIEKSAEPGKIEIIPKIFNSQVMNQLADILEAKGLLLVQGGKENYDERTFVDLIVFPHYHSWTVILEDGTSSSSTKNIGKPYVESVISIHSVIITGTKSILLVDSDRNLRPQYVVWIKEGTNQFYTLPGFDINIPHLIEKLRFKAKTMHETEKEALVSTDNQ